MLEEWGILLTVMALLGATLLLASVHHRYQLHQAEVQGQVRRLEHGLLRIKGALDQLGMVPLSRELRVLLRADVLARYQRIARLFRRYPEIRTRVAEAESVLQSEGPTNAAGVGPIADQQTFTRFTAALDTLHEVVRHGDLLQPLPPDVRTIFERELGERKAEVLARFHLVEAHRWQGLGEFSQGRSHLTMLMQTLSRQGPSTPFVKALYAEAEQAMFELNRKVFQPDDEPNPEVADAEDGRATA
jgi:GNAT superfamily N-acetyltransferase